MELGKRLQILREFVTFKKRLANSDRASDAAARPKPIAEKKQSEECL